MPMRNGGMLICFYALWEIQIGNGRNNAQWPPAPRDPPEGAIREGRLPGHLREGFGGASANLTGNSAYTQRDSEPVRYHAP